METEKKNRTITPDELQAQIKTAQPLTLIDVLPPDHYARIRLPGAKNACVFFVSFLDDLLTLGIDKQDKIVVYGSSGRCQDTSVAIDKMSRAGYQDVYELEGGIETWHKLGYDLEGEDISDPGDPQTTVALPDGNYLVDTTSSRIEWAGRNPTTRHTGTVDFLTGSIESKAGVISGILEVDMNSISNINLAGDDLQPVLEAHLRSDDFFFTQLFPTSVLEFRDIPPLSPCWQSAPNYRITGDLKLRGTTAALEFDATLNVTDEDTLVLEAHFDLDRTKWGIIYGSTRFFEHLGMHKVFDLISLQINISAKHQKS